MNKSIFTGAGVALVTPMNEQGIDFDSLGKLIDFQIENGTDAPVCRAGIERCRCGAGTCGRTRGRREWGRLRKHH